MTRTIRATVLAIAGVCAAASSAWAATPDEAARAVGDVGVYVEPGARAEPRELASIAGQAARAGLRYVPVVLATSPPAGATVFADGVLDRLGTGTVVVLTPSEIGYSSDEVPSSVLERAADAALPHFRSDPEAGFAAFANAVLARAAPGAARSPRAPRQPAIFGLLPLLFFGAILLFFIAPFRFARRSWQQVSELSVDDAKREVQRQVSMLADGILELADRVSVSKDAAARRHFQEASETFATAESTLARASSLGELERLADRLDHARWQLEAARASLEGREIPPEPADQPSSCFIDPAHGAGVQTVEVEGSGGEAAIVRICRRCDDQLRHGEVPQPRTVSVGGRAMPAGAAPRAAGGFGLGWLPLAFILPGLGSIIAGWGGSRRSAWGGEFFGGGTLGGFGMGGMSRSRGGFGGGMGRSRGSLGGGMGRSRGGRRL